MIRIETQPELDIETQAALAAGRADPGVALLLESALEMRGAGNLAADAIAAASFESEAPAPMRADALERAIASGKTACLNVKCRGVISPIVAATSDKRDKASIE